MLRKRIIFILILGLLAIATTSYATDEGVMTGDNIRLRTKPSTKNSTVLTLIEKNEKVEILAEEGKWYKVIYKGEEGYVSKQYVKVTKEIETNPKEEEPENNKPDESEGNSSENEEKPSEEEKPQASSNTNVEIKTPADGVIKVDSTLSILPLIHSTSIASVKTGTNVKVTECKNGWAYVVVSSRTSGWVRADKLNVETTSEAQENKKDSNSEENKATNKTSNTTKSTNTSQNTDKERNATNVTSRSSSERETVSEKKENTEKEETDKKESTASDKGEKIAEYAEEYKGYKYVSGGSSPSTGFDCSGFTYYIYKHFGYKIARTASAQAGYGTEVDKKDLQPGDLVLFSRGSYKIGHSGIYIGNNKFIHAANHKKGVVITSLSNEYYTENYVTARRLTK